MELVEPIRDRKKIQSMKTYLKGKNIRDYALFVLGINVGLRIGDLLSLKVGDVVDANGKVHDRIRLREQKTEKLRIFVIGESGCKAIKDYIDYRKGCCLDEPLFPSRKGTGPIQRGQARKILSSAAKAVGIMDPIGTHSLRKTFGYWAYKSGQDIVRLQALFNHVSPKVTLAYIGITQEEIEEVYLSVNL
ncbi:site-specific integrase [Ammoniphilus sp. CFH 90114]|uniref:site-specific integrase n=1 Tax=Ammoniphilus sp. CFH 90114 TaxID=2493665 RepID=UPI00100ED02A|nr:site-specific integrase [Ammoniphilus sp. CFH 90114]RXT00981.1 site-specific integrase [Ammoniphilus sp. CFH 90114]